MNPSTVSNLLKGVKDTLEFARSKDIREAFQELWGYMQTFQSQEPSRGGADDDPAAVSRALHRLHTRMPPRLALAGMTSSGKSSLLNALFGLPIADVRRTPDTTDCVIQVRFRSGLTIYDTPGFAGNEQFENVARAFLSIPQDPDLGKLTAIPLLQLNGPRSDLDVSAISTQHPVDAVLLLVDLSRTLTRADRKGIRNLVLELRRRYASNLIVVGTHFDLVKQGPPAELAAIISSFQELTDNLLTPISTVTGEGLAEVTLRIFQVLPEGVSLSALQETLLEERKASRLQFMVTEVSSILAQVALLDGKSLDEVRVWIVVLYLLICQHYSVDEGTWLRYNGDIIQIHEHVSQHGMNKITRERDPQSFWESFRARLFGTKFFENAIEIRRLGTAALVEITPPVYSLLYDLAKIPAPKYSEEEVARVILAPELDAFVSRYDANGLAVALSRRLLKLLGQEDLGTT